MPDMNKFRADMQAKAAVAKQEVQEFRVLVRDATLEEAAIFCTLNGGEVEGPALARGLRRLQS